MIVVLALLAACAATSSATAGEGQWRELDCDWTGSAWSLEVDEPVPLVAWVSDGDRWAIPASVMIIDGELAISAVAAGTNGGIDGYDADCVVFAAR